MAPVHSQFRKEPVASGHLLSVHATPGFVAGAAHVPFPGKQRGALGSQPPHVPIATAAAALSLTITSPESPPQSSMLWWTSKLASGCGFVMDPEEVCWAKFVGALA